MGWHYQKHVLGSLLPHVGRAFDVSDFTLIVTSSLPLTVVWSSP